MEKRKYILGTFLVIIIVELLALIGLLVYVNFFKDTNDTGIISKTNTSIVADY